MRKASFTVKDGSQELLITAIDLSARAGQLLPNVNRWRGQIQLDETTDEELKETATPFQVSGVDGHYVELLGPKDAERREAILGVVVMHEGKAWFFKMTGDAELALREKDRFQGFVKSVRFVAPEAPTEEAPAKEEPAETHPTESNPTEKESAKEAPIEKTSVKEVPAEDTPAEEGPAEEAPSEAVPAKGVSDEEAPVTEAPAEKASDEAAPKEGAAKDEATVEGAGHDE
jgi:hypothetical protein